MGDVVFIFVIAIVVVFIIIIILENDCRDRLKY